MRDALAAALALPPAALAQDGEFGTRFMMLNQHVCPPQNMEAVMDITRTALAPALEAAVEAAEADDWGVLTHAWGDEWNYNFYIVTEDHRAFLDAWDGLFVRMEELRPGWFDEFAELCTAHKDNLYVLHDYGD